jgi:hypothetical protein
MSFLSIFLHYTASLTHLVPMQWLETGDEPNGVLERVGHRHRQPLEGLLRVVGQDDNVGDAVSVQDRVPQVLQPLVQQRRQNCEGNKQLYALLQNLLEFNNPFVIFLL